MVQPLWKTIWQFFKRLKVELPYDAAIPLPVIYPREITACPHKNLHMNLHNSIIHNSQKVEATQILSTDEWIKYGTYIQWNITWQ